MSLCRSAGPWVRVLAALALAPAPSPGEGLAADYRFVVDDPGLPEVDCTLVLEGLEGPIAGRAVEDEAALRAAWASVAPDRGGGEGGESARVRLAVVRGDSGELVEIDDPLPETAAYHVPAGSLSPCLR